MRVLVCGGRDFTDESAVINWLLRFEEECGPFSRVIHGGARGADSLAGQWADLERIPQTVFKANWKKHGKAAGPIRNQQMLDEGKPDMVIALPGGRGTADMVRRAEASGVKVVLARLSPCGGGE